MEDLPLVIPENPTIFEVMYSILEQLHQSEGKGSDEEVNFFEEVSDALVYELYFGEGMLARHLTERITPGISQQTPTRVMNRIRSGSVQSLLDDIFSMPQVVEIEARIDTGH
jgi:hypothetical protein